MRNLTLSSENILERGWEKFTS